MRHGAAFIYGPTNHEITESRELLDLCRSLQMVEPWRISTLAPARLAVLHNMSAYLMLRIGAMGVILRLTRCLDKLNPVRVQISMVYFNHEVGS